MFDSAMRGGRSPPPDPEERPPPRPQPRRAALGVRLAIDDFGTGYSSLTYLKRIPIDVVKLDRGFLADLMHRQHDLTIVSAMIELVHGLGLRATAEGIETAAQLDKLRLLGCDLGQGYHFAAPVPAVRLPVLLQPRPELKASLVAPG